MEGPQTPFEWIFYLAEKFSKSFISGTELTLYITIVGTLVGFLLGFVVGVIGDIKISKHDSLFKKIVVRISKVFCCVYVEIFRDTPLIVQAMCIYYGLKLTGIGIEPIPAGILVTFLNTGAYISETVRAGINSIDLGQREGALALGMSPLKTMVFIILPQAFKNIIPELANMFLTNLKMTSVLNVIGISELFMVAKTTGAVYYKYFESYMVIAIIYFILCFVFNRIFLFIEKKMAGKKDYALAVEFMDDGK